ncbi:twin-arginine translocation protein TatB [Klebsiella pneumoniae]|nr:twin-arginine translocation protein TatB [Klebsiella pneumoniae]
MFDFGFSETLLVSVIGLIVLGPERLPGVVKTVARWVRAVGSMSAAVQQQLSDELQL